MAHRTFVQILLLLNAFMAGWLIQEANERPAARTCPYQNHSVEVAVYEFIPANSIVIEAGHGFQPMAIVPSIHPGLLPQHLQGFVAENQLACYSDGIHDMLAPADIPLRYEELYQATALLGGAEYGNQAVVRMLIENGVNPNIMDCFGNTPLSLAIEAGHAGLAHALMEYGADERLSAWSW